MSNTRLVVIKQIDDDSLSISLYYGRRKADQAKMTGIRSSSRMDIIDTIEEFRLHGLGD